MVLRMSASNLVYMYYSVITLIHGTMINQLSLDANMDAMSSGVINTLDVHPHRTEFKVK